MPCEDTTSSISVRIDKDERLIDYHYEKIACGKPVGAGKNYLERCAGVGIEEVAELSFDDAVKDCKPRSKEDEFLLYLEWKAVREALRQYLGMTPDADSGSYKIAEIISGPEETTIEMIIFPPDELPPIVPCHEQER